MNASLPGAGGDAAVDAGVPPDWPSGPADASPSDALDELRPPGDASSVVAPCPARPADVDLGAFGATGDGQTDDTSALAAALSAAAGHTLRIPAGTFLVSRGLTVPPNTKVCGLGPKASTIDLHFSGSYGALLTTQGSTTLSGLHLLRSSGSADLIALGAGDGIVIANTELDGGLLSDAGPTDPLNGIHFANTGAFSNIVFDGIEVHATAYGSFQENAFSGTVTNFVVRNSYFHDQSGDDLAFNTPGGTTTGVAVIGSVFENNHGTGSAGGFGVSFANAQNITVAGNTFRNYANEAIHFENGSGPAKVYDNHISASGLRFYSYGTGDVTILAKVHDVEIFDNYFDATANTTTDGVGHSQADSAYFDAIYIGPGGAPASDSPTRIDIHDNGLTLVGTQLVQVNYGTGTVTQANNVTDSQAGPEIAQNSIALGDVRLGLLARRDVAVAPDVADDLSQIIAHRHDGEIHVHLAPVTRAVDQLAGPFPHVAVDERFAHPLVHLCGLLAGLEELRRLAEHLPGDGSPVVRRKKLEREREDVVAAVADRGDEL